MIGSTREELASTMYMYYSYFMHMCAYVHSAVNRDRGPLCNPTCVYNVYHVRMQPTLRDDVNFIRSRLDKSAPPWGPYENIPTEFHVRDYRMEPNDSTRPRGAPRAVPRSPHVDPAHRFKAFRSNLIRDLYISGTYTEPMWKYGLDPYGSGSDQSLTWSPLRNLTRVAAHRTISFINERRCKYKVLFC